MVYALGPVFDLSQKAARKAGDMLSTMNGIA